MRFKVHTKDTIYVIETETDEKAENYLRDMTQLCEKFAGESKNVVIQLKGNPGKDGSEWIESLKHLHQTFYSQNLSFVLVAEDRNTYQQIRKQVEIDQLNLSPTLQEAEDIIHMEILERELSGE